MGVCLCGFCNVWASVCMGLQCVVVRMFGFCNVWLCVCVGFVIRRRFDNYMGVWLMCVLVFTVFCIVSFMFIYSYLFCL